MRPFFAFRQKSLFIAGRTSMRRAPKIKNKNIFLYQGCLIQHRNWPLRSTILNAHDTNASPDGLCTRTHTNEAFSCWFCCNSFRVDRARCVNVCLSRQGMLSYRSACPEFKDGLGINMTMKTFFTLTYHIMHAQQQLARDLEVERAAMGQHCRPQSFGEVQRGNPQPRRWLDFL